MSSDERIGRTRELLDLARVGQRGALDELFERFRPPLRAFLHARLPTSARGLLETDDLVQEVLTSAFGALERFEDRGAGAFWGYLRQIGINHVRQALRRQQAGKRGTPVQLESSAMAPPDSAAGPLASLLAKEEFEAFESALERISPQQRKALLMRFELDAQYTEVAADCGFPSADAARAAVRRAIASVAKELAGE